MRQPGYKPTNAIWVFCEGETEKNYLFKYKTLERISRIRIKVRISKEKDAVGLVNYALEYINHNKKDFQEGDSIVCVFDRDDNSDSDLQRAKSIVKENNINIVFSNPCFEFWFLCHYGFFPL